MLNSKLSKIKSPFMIYADFGSILVPEDNRKQNPNDQKHVTCSNGYELVCVDDNLSRLFTILLEV